MNLLKKILAAWVLCLAAGHLSAAPVWFAVTNSSGVDTNYIRIQPLIPFGNANGSYTSLGVPFRIYPNANGYVITNLPPGTYSASNQFIVQNYFGLGQPGTPSGIIFNVDTTTNVSSFLRYPRSSTGGGVNLYNWYMGITGIGGTNGFTVITNGDGTVTLNGENFTVSSNQIYQAGIGTFQTPDGGSNFFYANVTNVIVALADTNRSSVSTAAASTSRLTLTTNGPNVAFAALSQTNDVVHTNEARVMRFAGNLNVDGKQTNSQTATFQSDVRVEGNITMDGLIAAGSIQTLDQFIGDAEGLTDIPSGMLVGTIPTNLIRGITVTNFDLNFWSLATNRNNGTAATTLAVVAGVTNQWRNDIAVSNAASAVNYQPGSANLTNYATFPTNHFQVTNVFTANLGTASTNPASRFQPATENGTNWANVSTNGILPLAASNNITIYTILGTNWIVGSAGGSGTGIQTNAGSGNLNTLTNLSAFGSLNASLITNVTKITGPTTSSLVITGNAGTDVIISGGQNIASGSVSGGVYVLGGTNVLGDGGAVNIFGGSTFAPSKSAGSISISGGRAFSASTVGGSISISGGFGETGGSVSIIPGTASLVKGSVTIGTSGTTTTLIGSNYLASASITNLSLGGARVMSWTTNVVGVNGAGSAAANGTFERFSNLIYTNQITHSTITNNSGTWVIRDITFSSLYTASALDGTWSVASGSLPVPVSQYGYTNDHTGAVIYGPVTSTNLEARFIHPTNMPPSSDGMIPVSSGTSFKLTTLTSILNTTNFSYRVIYGSLAGIAGNANPDTGAGSDDTVRIQNILNSALTAGPLEYHQDKISKVSSNGTPAGSVACLTIYPNTRFVMEEGCGIYMASNTYLNVIANSLNTNYGTTNISIIGGHIWNNGYGQTIDGGGGLGYTVNNQPANTTQPYINGIWLAGVDNFRIQNVTVHHPLVSGIVMENCRNGYLSGNILDGRNAKPSGTFGAGGLQFWNNNINLTIRDTTFISLNDDGIQFNCNEMPMAFTTLTNLGRFTTNSYMTNILLDGVVFEDCNNAGKFAAWGFTNYLQSVEIKNVRGRLKNYGFSANGTTIPTIEKLGLRGWNIDLDSSFGTSINLWDGSIPCVNFSASDWVVRWLGDGGGDPLFIFFAQTNIQLSDMIFTGTKTGPNTPFDFQANSSTNLNVNMANITLVNGDTIFTSSDGDKQGTFRVANLNHVGINAGAISDGVKTNVVGLEFKARIKNIVGVGSAPTIVTNAGGGAGTSGGTASISGTDLAGDITLNTGASTVAATSVFTVTFNTAYSGAAYTLLTPANSTAAGIPVSALPWLTNTATTMTLMANTNALTASSIFKWHYHVMQ